MSDTFEPIVTQRVVRVIENPRTLAILDYNYGVISTNTRYMVGDSGYSGATGTDGAPGPSGYSGFSGESNISGWSGYSGDSTSGYSGASGASGYSGSGISGYSGAGTSGYSGYSGEKGTDGVIGVDGASGTSGYSGAGTSGYSGEAGPEGPEGPQGPDGPEGPSGTSGYSGAGTSGFSGYSGQPGAASSSGTSGYSGTSGTSGYSGQSGKSGTSGYSGAGTSGFSGYSGAGQSGVSGYSGAATSGASGTSGYSGQVGPQGASTGLIYYFHNEASDIGGYEGLMRSPANSTQDDESVTCTLANTEYLIDSYATVANDPALSAIPPGQWVFHGYHYVDNVAGVSEIIYRVYKRTTGGTETEIFNVSTGEINATTTTEYTTSYTQVTSTATDATDRIIIKVYAKSTSAGRVLHFVYEGSTNVSYVITPLGATGVSGYSGYSGQPGNSGYSGQLGNSGYSGTSGNSGISGYSGQSGTSGYSGALGTSGYSGAGTSGFSGYSGASLGDSGYSGASGSSGYSGATASVTFASAAEVTAGTETTKAINPDVLAGSSIFGRKAIVVKVFEATADWATGDAKADFDIPECMNGMNLVRCYASVNTAGTTNTSDIQIRNVTQTADMLSTKMTIDSTETSTATAATAAVIDTNNDDVATNDKIAIDIDAASTTKPKGLTVVLEFALP